jgi:hypothetical protein
MFAFAPFLFEIGVLAARERILPAPPLLFATGLVGGLFHEV